MITRFKAVLSPLNKFVALEFVWLFAKYFCSKKENYPNINLIFRRSIDSIINKLKIVRIDNSFAGETPTLQKILKKIEYQDSYLVDIGASDGITQSSTVKFLIGHNYSGLLLEFEPKNFSKLAFLYDDRNDICLAKIKITPNNIVQVMKSYAVPQDFTLLNLDIDSYDLEVLRSLLMGGFSPKVISMEINEIFPPNIEFEVIYSPDHSWQGDHFMGCSVASAQKTLESLNYSLVEIQYNNAFFVNNSIAYKSDFNRNIFDLYDQGYRNKIDRKSKFHGNSDVEYLLSASPKECEEKLRTLFLQYEGKYLLKISQ
jgi:hypothetical protein